MKNKMLNKAIVWCLLASVLLQSSVVYASQAQGLFRCEMALEVGVRPSELLNESGLIQSEEFFRAILFVTTGVQTIDNNAIKKAFSKTKNLPDDSYIVLGKQIIERVFLGDEAQPEVKALDKSHSVELNRKLFLKELLASLSQKEEQLKSLYLSIGKSVPHVLKLMDLKIFRDDWRDSKKPRLPTSLVQKTISAVMNTVMVIIAIPFVEGVAAIASTIATSITGMIVSIALPIQISEQGAMGILSSYMILLHGFVGYGILTTWPSPKKIKTYDRHATALEELGFLYSGEPRAGFLNSRFNIPSGDEALQIDTALRNHNHVELMLYGQNQAEELKDTLDLMNTHAHLVEQVTYWGDVKETARVLLLEVNRANKQKLFDQLLLFRRKLRELTVNSQKIMERLIVAEHLFENKVQRGREVLGEVLKARDLQNDSKVQLLVHRMDELRDSMLANRNASLRQRMALSQDYLTESSHLFGDLLDAMPTQSASDSAWRKFARQIEDALSEVDE